MNMQLAEIEPKKRKKKKGKKNFQSVDYRKNTVYLSFKKGEHDSVIYNRASRHMVI